MSIVIFSPVKPGYSETFINVHIHKLPFQTYNIHSLPKRGYFPIYDGHGQVLFSDNIVVNYLEAGIDRLFGESGIGYTLRKKNLKKFLKDQSITHAISEYGPTGTYVMNLLSEMDIPLIPYFHGRDAFHYQTLDRFGKKYKRLFDQAYKIFCVSKNMRDQLLSLGADASKIIINPCTPNTDVFKLEQKSRIRNQFMSVGRFCDKKAPLNTIKSVELALNEVEDLSLLMIGDGPLFEDCKSYIEENGLADQIKLLGRKAPEDIAKMFNESFGFLQHSVRAKDGDSEGTPVAVMEAMVCGCPVISTYHAGIPDVVKDGVHGYLVEEGDVEGMSKKIIALTQLENIEQMRHACVNRVLTEYTLEKHINRISQVLQ